MSSVDLIRELENPPFGTKERKLMIAAAERIRELEKQAGMQHVAYFDEGQFHWMSGIAPRECELFSPWSKP